MLGLLDIDLNKRDEFHYDKNICLNRVTGWMNWNCMLKAQCNKTAHHDKSGYQDTIELVQVTVNLLVSCNQGRSICALSLFKCANVYHGHYCLLTQVAYFTNPIAWLWSD